MLSCNMKSQSIFLVLSCLGYTLGNSEKFDPSHPQNTTHVKAPLWSRDTGGISFTLPSDIAVSINSYLAGNNTCPILGVSHKRVPDDVVECLAADAENILDALGVNGPLAALFNQIQAGAIAIPPQPEEFADEGTVQALSLVMSYAADTLPTLQTGIAADLIQKVAFTVFCIVFSFVFINAAILETIAIGQSFLTPNGNSCIVGWKPRCNLELCVGQNGICTGAYFKGCPCDDKSCPAPEEDGLICSLDCGGADSTGKCVGDTDGDWRGCDCIDLWDLPFYNADDHAYQDISGILAALPEAVVTTCKPMTGNIWTYGPAAELYVKDFCANPANLVGYFGDQISYTYDPASTDSTTLQVTFLSSTSENIAISQADCNSNFWNILNCPRSSTNAYGGITQFPSGGPILEIIPNAGQPNLRCDPGDPLLLSGSPASYKTALNRDGMVAAYTDFCHKNANASVANVPRKFATYGPFGGPFVPGHQNIRIGATTSFIDTPRFVPADCVGWDRNLDEQACLKVFGELTDGCDVGTTTGKRGGTTQLACVEYTMVGANGAPDIFRLHIHQKMVDEFSQLEWALYDSRGTTVGGPSTSGTATGAPQDLGFHVDSPTNKDNTNVRMFYPNGGKFQWSTGWTGKAGSAAYNKEYYCDDVLSGGAAGWTNWQSNGRNGFERQFDCYFRGWGHNDGDIIN